MGDEKIQYLTQQGLENLETELLDLKDNKIPQIAKRIDEAKQLGDLSENAEYHAAKEDMGWAQSRLAEVKVILENAEVIKTGATGKIDLGSTVKFKTDKGKEKTYTIVGAQEADPLNGKISNESPIGRAFLGSKSGDKISVDTPAGSTEYKILDVK